MGKILKKVQSMTSIVVWNLSYCTTAKDLKRSFEKFGEVGDVYIPMDKRTRESRGFAFVRFLHERDAKEAKIAMHRSTLNGREVRINMAHRWQVPRGKPWRGLGRFSQHGKSRSTSRSRSRSWSSARSGSRSDGICYRSRSRSVRSRSSDSGSIRNTTDLSSSSSATSHSPSSSSSSANS